MFWRGRSKKGEGRRSAVPAKSVEKMLGKAKRLADAGRHDKAGPLCDDILEADPNNTVAMEIKAAGAIVSGDLKRALRWYDRALKIDPDNADLMQSKAAVLNMRGKPRAALKFCNEALKIDPDNEYVMGEKGLALKNMRRFDDALECYDHVLAANPG